MSQILGGFSLDVAPLGRCERCPGCALHKSGGYHLHDSLFWAKIRSNPETTSSPYTLLLNCVFPAPSYVFGLISGTQQCVCVCVCVNKGRRKRGREGEKERQTGRRKGRETRDVTDPNRIVCIQPLKRLTTGKITLSSDSS